MAPSPSTCAPDGGLDPMDVCVVGVASMPINALLGCLSSLPATKLGSVAIQGALRRVNVDPALVPEVSMGNILSTKLG
uniref:Thiolase N-terminal domain-containing protein n=1 Tax=Triticum urartu TaxID=4572 RepID=A0A8R7VB69_TRIUA